MTSHARCSWIRSRCGVPTSTARHRAIRPLTARPSKTTCLEHLVGRLAEASRYAARRAEIAAWNATDPVIRRGLALTPVKFGISFTSTMFNQAGALVHVYSDGTVLLNHGGTEMGQGLFTKVAQVVAAELGVPLSLIRVSAHRHRQGAQHLGERRVGQFRSQRQGRAGCRAHHPRAARDLARRNPRRRHATACASTTVACTVGSEQFSFADVVLRAYRARISLSSTGFYRTPKIQWDKARMRGRPFFYFAYGAAVSEVAVDTLTGETRLLRVDILHDVGASLNPAIDMGQIEGGFLQGVGWLTSEELWWNARGELQTHAPSTYKIPTARDWPAQATIRMLEHAPNREDTIYRSKAVGEPPLMLAISALHAIRDAVAAAGVPGVLPLLSSPATPEAVLRALSASRRRSCAA